MKKIYLTGPVAERDVQQLEEFQRVKELLEEQGFDVKTAIDHLPDGDLRGNPYANQISMHNRFLALNQSDQVIYLEGYEEDPLSHSEVYQAQHLYALPVHSATNFLMHHHGQPATFPACGQLTAAANAR